MLDSEKLDTVLLHCYKDMTASVTRIYAIELPVNNDDSRMNAATLFDYIILMLLLIREPRFLKTSFGLMVGHMQCSIRKALTCQSFDVTTTLIHKFCFLLRSSRNILCVLFRHSLSVTALAPNFLTLSRLTFERLCFT